MTEVLSPADLAVVQLQIDELAQQGIDLEDADYAFQLQLQEAMRASAPSMDLDCSIVDSSMARDEASVNIELQTAALRQAAVALADAQQASSLQSDFQQRQALEVHDLQVASWLNNVSEADWDRCGDNLQRPVSQENLQHSDLQGVLTFAGYTQGHYGGFAAMLTTTSGEQVWQGTKAHDGNAAAQEVAAQLQGLHMGLLAAKQFSFQRLVIQAPNSRPLLQALDATAACSSDVSAQANAVLELMESFASVRTEAVDSRTSWPVHGLALQACILKFQGDQTCSVHAASSIRRNSREGAGDDDMIDLTEEEDHTESCAICLEEVLTSKVHVIGGCLHRFCVSCLQNHTHNKLKDRQYPMTCPQPSCDTKITSAECDILLKSSQDRQLLAQLAAEASIPESARFYCPYARCSTLMVSDKTAGPNTSAECPACHRLLCLWCRTPGIKARPVEKPRQRKQTTALCYSLLDNAAGDSASTASI